MSSTVDNPAIPLGETSDPADRPAIPETSAESLSEAAAEIEASTPGSSAGSDISEQQQKELEQEGQNLKKRTVNAGKWMSFGYAANQLLRFVSNVTLAYLLAPEHFGIMALISVIVSGLLMFSDIGIGPSLIQNKRQAFRNTAWTLQTIRGTALWLVACAAAYPLSLIDGWGPLAYLLPVAALTTVISGLQSTAWHMASRQLNLKMLATYEFVTSIIRIAAMVAFAYFISRTAWALVVGVLIGSTAQTLMSYKLPNSKNWFQIERAALGDLIRYGRWLFISTIITFWAGQIDKLLLGSLLSPAVLGIYWIGLQLADLGPTFFKKLGHSVGFPALSNLYRRDEDRYKQRLKQLRMLLILPINGLLLSMILGGPIFMALIYPGPYVEAGWIVQVLAFNSLAGMVTTTYGNAYMASGHTRHNMTTVAAQLIIMVSATLLGFYFFGGTGFILGIGVSQWLKYPVDAWLARSLGIYDWKLDLSVLISSAALAFAAVKASTVLAEWMFL